jgi:hypothetical protein
LSHSPEIGVIKITKIGHFLELGNAEHNLGRATLLSRAWQLFNNAQKLILTNHLK